jgi:Mg2+-importing ATPase
LFGNPLTLILLAAATASIVLHQVLDGAIIFAIVTVSTVIDLAQAQKSGQAVRSLQQSVASTSNVLRDGIETSVLRREVVPGDVVHLRAGDLVPADCRLIRSNDLHATEAALTGESIPAEKHANLGLLPTDSPSDTPGCVFQGTSIVSGEAFALVVRTGRETVFGDIAIRLVSRPPETEFQRGLREFGVLILKTVVFLVLFVFLTSIVMRRDPFESLIFSVALAVGLTPEFLPMITSLTLSQGAVRMAKLGVVVKTLPSIQNLGSVDILCTDKTGTLTTGVMSLEKVVGPTGQPDENVLEWASINSRFQSGVANSLDDAILLKGKDLGTDAAKVDEAPFDFERRRVSLIADWRGSRHLICKGAAESVLAVCTDSSPEAVKVASDLGDQGYRVLAVGIRVVEAKAAYSSVDEVGLSLVGFLAFLDPAIPDAASTIEAMRKAGVEVKIISGDHPAVTRTVCQLVGLDAGEVVLGDDIEAMTDTALQHVAEQTRVFARVSPGQKNRIILALKARGHVVGYMGDGINDAPSLHAADVGISVSTAVEVARDAADIILLRPGLDALREGIRQGRAASGNVLKYLLMGTSSNFGNMFSMAGANLFLPFLPMLPTQILLNNFLYDISQISIPTDEVDPEIVALPRKWDVGLVKKFMVLIGPVSSIFDFLTFWALLKVFGGDPKVFHTGWFVESLATQTLVILVIRTFGLPWRSRPSKPLALTVSAVLVAAIALPYTPLGQPIGLVPLPIGFYGFLLVTTVVYLTLVQWVKQRLFSEAFKRIPVTGA